MQRLKKHILPYAVAILSACVLAFALCGCDSNKIPLQQEVTMETEWGPVAHYNVKTNWTTYDTLTGSDRSSSFAYYENNINPEDGFIFFMLTNPHTDKYESGSDLFLTPDTVALVKTNHSQYAHHLVVERNWEALSQEESDGITFDRYKYSCNVTYYNSQYPWNKGSDYKEGTWKLSMLSQKATSTISKSPPAARTFLLAFSTRSLLIGILIQRP